MKNLMKNDKNSRSCEFFSFLRKLVCYLFLCILRSVGL